MKKAKLISLVHQQSISIQSQAIIIRKQTETIDRMINQAQQDKLELMKNIASLLKG